MRRFFSVIAVFLLFSLESSFPQVFSDVYPELYGVNGWDFEETIRGDLDSSFSGMYTIEDSVFIKKDSAQVFVISGWPDDEYNRLSASFFKELPSTFVFPEKVVMRGYRYSARFGELLPFPASLYMIEFTTVEGKKYVSGADVSEVENGAILTFKSFGDHQLKRVKTIAFIIHVFDDLREETGEKGFLSSFFVMNDIKMISFGSNQDTITIDTFGSSIVSGMRELPGIPTGFTLHQNYPNPFNPATKIRYGIQKTGDVKLSVYDILGKEVSILVNQEQQAGIYEAEFDASSLSSGTYVAVLSSNGQRLTKKMVLLK